IASCFLVKRFLVPCKNQGDCQASVDARNSPLQERFSAHENYSSGLSCFAFSCCQRRSTSASKACSKSAFSGRSKCLVLPMCLSHSDNGTRWFFSSGLTVIVVCPRSTSYSGKKQESTAALTIFSPIRSSDRQFNGHAMSNLPYTSP